jgi:L-ascorbate metabolism protein UlaG (beta-lactamase superfamily)
MSIELTWLGHASFRIVVDTDFVIYIDPWDIETNMTADLVLITHSHYDHLSPEDVGKVRGEATQVLIPPDGASKLPGPVTQVHRNGVYHVGPVEVHAVAAYSVGKSFHPDSEGWVGYRITTGGRTIYHAGDTDLIPEMAKIQADVALLPIGGTYTMGVEEALRAVSMIKPRIVIPMHFGRIIGSPEDAARFARQAPEGVEVRVLGEGEATSL